MKSLLSSAATLVVAAGTLAAQPAAAQDTQEVRWATSSVGTSGHRALVSLAQILNREMDGIEITVMPTPGAAASVRGFAAGQFDGYYGADIAFHEIATDSGRYKGFSDADVENELVQSFWAYTLEMGLGIRAEDSDELNSWSDLSGHPVFTGPAPWDTRAALERAMDAVGVEHEYVELDTGLAGQSLQDGTIDAFSIYTTGETTPSPWVQEAMLTTNVAVLNPSEEEIAAMEEQGIRTVSVSKEAFDTDIGVDEAILVPFYYGFHVGTNLSEDQVYNMLVTIEENIDEIVEADPGLSQLQDGMVEMQTRGIESAGDSVPIHPGLARYLRERDAWNEEWNDRIASAG